MQSWQTRHYRMLEACSAQSIAHGRYKMADRLMAPGTGSAIICLPAASIARLLAAGETDAMALLALLREAIMAAAAIAFAASPEAMACNARLIGFMGTSASRVSRSHPHTSVTWAEARARVSGAAKASTPRRLLQISSKGMGREGEACLISIGDRKSAPLRTVLS